MLVVFVESESSPPMTAAARELASIAGLVQTIGHRMIALPPPPIDDEGAESAFAFVRAADSPTTALWLGYIPSAESYRAVYDAAARRNLLLVNSPEQFRNAMEFDRFYPIIAELTARSAIVFDVDGARDAARELGFPIFLKGAIKSAKEDGWAACIAADEAELRARVEALLARPSKSRGRVILRRTLALRRLPNSTAGFPRSREFRVFLLDGEVLAHGAYWDDRVPECALGPGELREVYALAVAAAVRIGTPYIAVDIAQLDDGSWTIIEVGDGQFSGLSEVPALTLWGRLNERLSTQAGRPAADTEHDG